MTIRAPVLLALLCFAVAAVSAFVPQTHRRTFHRRPVRAIAPPRPRPTGAVGLAASASSSVAAPSSPPPRSDATKTESTIVDPWTWRGHRIHAETTGDPTGRSVLLIHGFGCSSYYWRETASALAANGYDVHAVDLLGQGKSDKPTNVTISINLWAALVDDYVRERIAISGRGARRKGGGNILADWFNPGKKKGGQRSSDDDSVVLVGNSLGSLVALAAALGDHAADDDDGSGASDGSDCLREPYLASQPGRVGGICMYNCGVGLNSRGVVDEPQWTAFQRILIQTVLATTDALLFNNPPVLRYVLREVVTPDLLRGALQGLYRYDPTRVDDALVTSFYEPAKDEGAPEALRQIYTNDPGLSPMQLHDKHPDAVGALPIHLVWGDDDAVTPLTGGVGTFYAALASDDDSRVSMDVIGGTGHVPFDDAHLESNESMLRWLSNI